MDNLHILRVPTHIVSEKKDGERWCFYCRKRVAFTRYIHAPDDPLSYYGPTASIRCTQRQHIDGDCFPGTYRTWDDPI